MSIYGKGIGWDFSSEKLKYFVLIALIVLSVVGVWFFVVPLLKPHPITYFFSSNPLDLSMEQNTVLTVDVVNVTNADGKNVLLEVIPVDEDALIVYPVSREIATLGKNETRRLEFSIRTNPKKPVYTGNYKIKILLTINSEQFEEEAVLRIKTV